MTAPSSSSVPQEESRDAMALTGLRRMVLHARDQLGATKRALPAGDFTYGDHWRPGEIRRAAAAALAEQVLTLVADCIPADGGMSPDEASQVRALLERRERQLADKTQALLATRDSAKKAEDLRAAAESELRLSTAAFEESDVEIERLRGLAEAVRMTPTTDHRRTAALIDRMQPDCWCDADSPAEECPVHPQEVPAEDMPVPAEDMPVAAGP